MVVIVVLWNSCNMNVKIIIVYCESKSARNIGSAVLFFYGPCSALCAESPGVSLLMSASCVLSLAGWEPGSVKLAMVVTGRFSSAIYWALSSTRYNRKY